MDSLKAMVDVNTVVGDPVETKEGAVIIPVSRVSFGFVTGGGDEALVGAESGDYGQSDQSGQEPGSGDTSDQVQGPGTPGPEELYRPMPFTGGTGAGVSVRPVGFLVMSDRKVRFLPVDSRALFDRLIEEAPEILDKLAGTIERHREDRRREADREHPQGRGEDEGGRFGTSE
jgi:sporulation protein YtfJ